MRWIFDVSLTKYEADVCWILEEIGLEYGAGWLPELCALTERHMGEHYGDFTIALINFAWLYFKYWANVGLIIDGTEWIVFNASIFEQ